MEITWLVLGAAGGSAVAWRFGRAVFSLARHASDALWANELSWTRARSGDLTGMREAEDGVRSARTERIRAGAAVLLWGALLLGPALLPWTREAYSVLVLVWLLPGKRRVNA